MIDQKHTYYEFFSGGGMARLGLQSNWTCIFANDFSSRKAKSYRENFPPAHELIEADVFNLTSEDIPDKADLAWASFPCQDLSLAGYGRGLNGHRSGSLWGFWRIVEKLIAENRAPSLIVLENVAGAITANQGQDFQILLQVLIKAGYQVGPMVIDAQLFVPQSRPRLFIVASRRELTLPDAITQKYADDVWHPGSIQRAHRSMPSAIKDSWIWWQMPKPPPRANRLIDLIDENPEGVQWHKKEETQRLLSLMTPLHQKKIISVQRSGIRSVGAVYRRSRLENGRSTQRAEVRFDDISGCLRTSSGGSSRQFIITVHGEEIRSRLLSPREAARLMGIDDSYRLPTNYNEAYHLIGDGLVVPVVTWLSDHILVPAITPGWYLHEAYRQYNEHVQARLLMRRVNSLEPVIA